jgi:hypothetical protein
MSSGPFTLVASAAQTATGNSGPLALNDASVLDLEVNVSAVSGTTPSMTLAVQWSNDGVNFGSPDGGGDTFAAVTAAGTVAKQLTVKGLWAQIGWTITGTTPSFTFSVISS